MRALVVEQGMKKIAKQVGKKIDGFRGKIGHGKPPWGWLG